MGRPNIRVGNLVQGESKTHSTTASVLGFGDFKWTENPTEAEGLTGSSEAGTR
jgi:hypothetical protein